MNEFEYGAFFVQYLARNNRYWLFDTVIGAYSGTLELVEGPGWVFVPSASRSEYDLSELTTLATLVSELNSVLSEQFPPNTESEPF